MVLGGSVSPVLSPHPQSGVTAKIADNKSAKSFFICSPPFLNQIIPLRAISRRHAELILFSVRVAIGVA